MNKNIENQEPIVQLFDAILHLRLSSKRFLQSKMKEEGQQVTYEMFQVLYFLWHQNEVNQQEIAIKVAKTKASITPLIDNLVKIGLVQRKEDTVDRRNKIICLTKEGNKYKEKFAPMFFEFYSQLQGSMSDDKVREITAILLDMKKRM